MSRTHNPTRDQILIGGVEPDKLINIKQNLTQANQFNNLIHRL